MAALARTLYRALLRQAKAASDSRPMLLLGPFALQSPTPYHYVKDVGPKERLLGAFSGIEPASLKGLDIPHDGIKKQTMWTIIQREFRRFDGVTDDTELGKAYDHGFSSLRKLSTLAPLQHTASLTVTENVSVELMTKYRTMFQDRHVFDYKLRIKNIGDHKLRLLNRSWQFKDSEGFLWQRVPKSPGVVGQTPILKPGACFEYISYTEMRGSGSMEGEFEMVYMETGERFNAIVAPAALLVQQEAINGDVDADHDDDSDSDSD